MSESEYRVELSTLVGTSSNRGTFTPASREKLEREISELIDTCAKPRKLRDMLVLLDAMKLKDARGK